MFILFDFFANTTGTLKCIAATHAIPIPEDIDHYDKEKFREFDNMYLESFYYTFYSKEAMPPKESGKNGPKVAVVLGGQAGAGKSSLVADTKREFQDAGRRIVLIDDDQYRKLYQSKFDNSM